MKSPKFILLLTFVLLFFAALTGRLIYIQIIKGDFYKALAQGMHSLGSTVKTERGEIFFKNHEPLAINKNWPIVWALPKNVQNHELVAQKLSNILQLPQDLILDRIKRDKPYVALKSSLSDEEVKLIQEANLPGIYFDSERGRYYPQETMGSQVSGFWGGEKSGQYGLEEYYDQTLMPNEKDGQSLSLTIDYEIQFQAEKLLREAKENENIDMKSGTIIVIEPDTGKILAMANYPNFNPNDYRETAGQGLGVFQNEATQKTYEPGSVFKPITMAIALNEEKVTPETTYTDKGFVKIGGWTINNYDNRVYGEVSMTTVLEQSINTGMIFTEGKIGHNIFLDYIEKFGFFEKTGIDLNESLSENKEFKKGYEINFATASFGQGIEITPIQLIKAYCALANGGKLVKPYIVEKILDKDKVISETKPEVAEKPIISPQTSRQITTMLVSVTTNGIAKKAQVPGYYVAGKTGTALIPYSILGEPGKGYSDKTWQSFVGYLPAYNPKVVILVKLDQSKTRTSEFSAIPMFQKMAQFIV
ncbi:MAG: penicillin-binding protein 2, partial [Patescibacteria group bacterium]